MILNYSNFIILERLNNLKIKVRKMDYFQILFNGAISGLFTVFITQPFQVVRTSMMVTYLDGKPSGCMHIINKLYSTEGIKGFYRGLFPSFIKTPIGTAIYFSSLEYYKKILKNFNKQSNQRPEILTGINFLASAGARFNQCILLNPVIVAITRFEVIGFNAYSSLLDALIKIKQQEGLQGYTKGLKPLLIKEVPSAAMFYALYEIFKKMNSNLGINNIVLQTSSSAMLANIILTFLNNPIDVIRTRLQYLHFSGNKNHHYSGICEALATIARTEGFKGLAVGMIPRILKRATASAISWSIYEILSQKKK